MSTTHETSEITETSTKPYSIYPPAETRFIEGMKNSVNQYRQSIENYQQDWLRSYKNNLELIETVQREFTERSDTTISMIDASTRIIMALNDYAKAGEEWNHTITQIWIRFWSPKRD